MNEQKILEILYELKEFCENNICKTCALSDDDCNCMLQNYEPCEWKLNNQPPKKWNAFRIEDME